MKTIHTLFLTLLLVFWGTASFAQIGNEKIKERMVAFLSNKLQLTTTESEKFWPIYNKYRVELKELNKLKRFAKEKTEDIDQLTDAQVEQMLQDNISFMEKRSILEKKYLELFKKVLPVKKIAKLYSAQEQFKQQLMRKLKEKKEQEE